MIPDFEIFCPECDKIASADYMIVGIDCSCGSTKAVAMEHVRTVQFLFDLNSRDAMDFATALIHAKMFPDMPEIIGHFKIEPRRDTIIKTTTVYYVGPVTQL